MKDMRIAFDAELAQLDPDAWLTRLEELSEDLGYFEPLGDAYCAAFIDAGPKLFITFENAETIRRSNTAAEPRGYAYVREDGWSHLAIISHSESWFRDPAVYRYIDRLIDDGFFEDFDRVLFHGTGACGYAAAAFSVAAPGCTVLALRPQATLNARVAAFDTRYLPQRRLDFTTRYGYAPDMIDAVDHAFIAFDPTQQIDAIHASLFTRDNVTALRCNCLGNKLDLALDQIGIHDELIRHAMDGTLNEDVFAKLIRARRKFPNYARGIFSQMMRRDHPVLAANVCAHVLRERDDPFFAKKLDELMAQGHHPNAPRPISAVS